jgi:RimJ/RimL family protein N-acetyltransferase
MFARTDRLLLRPGWIEDAPALARGLGDSAVSRNLARVPFPYSLADAEAWLGRAGDDGLPSLLVFARTRRAPRLVGGVGLHRGGDGAVELGYWIGRPYWGLGFATEAAGAMVRLAHDSLRLPRIVSGHFRDNPASANVLRKLGFRSTGGSVVRHSLARGGDVACLLFARDAEDGFPEPGDRALAA